MKIHCPLCEQEIVTESQVVDGQHVVCPYCEKKFTFFCNTTETPPLIIASGEEFEKYLCNLVNELACADCEQTKASGDQGVDLIVTLKGGKRIAIQCKLYSSPVGNDAVQQVIAGQIYYKCDMAAVVTNNTYTDSAIELANVSNVMLLHYTNLAKWLSDLGGSNKSKSELFKENFTAFIEQYPNYAAEISLHLKYKLAPLYSYSPEELLLDMEDLQAEVQADGRRLMRETVRLVYVLGSDAATEILSSVERGYFGKSFARIHETYEATHNPVKLETVDEDGWAGIGKYISLSDRLDFLLSQFRTLISGSNLKDQIFRDELLSEHLAVVTEDYHSINDKELYEKIATGQFVEFEVSRIRRLLMVMFEVVRDADVPKWNALKVELKKRKG